MHPCQPLPWPQPRPSTQLASKARRNNSTTHTSVSSARAFPHHICPPTDRTPRGPEAVILHTGNPGPERSRDRSKVALPQIKTLPPVTTQPPQHTVPKCWTQKEKGKLGQEILFTPGPRFLSGQSARWACILRGESNVWRNHYALLTWRVCRGLAPVLLDPEVEDPQRELSARLSASPKSLRPSRPCWSDTDLAFLALLPALPSHHQPQIPVQNTFTISADELQGPISPQSQTSPGPRPHCSFRACRSTRASVHTHARAPSFRKLSSACGGDQSSGGCAGLFVVFTPRYLLQQSQPLE